MARATLDNGRVAIEATDTGNARTRLMGIKLSTPDGKREWTAQEGCSYLLPGDTQLWTVGLAGALSKAPLRLRARTDVGTVEGKLEVEAP